MNNLFGGKKEESMEGEPVEDNWKGSGEECRWPIMRGDDLIKRLGVSGGCAPAVDKRLAAL